jgi:hypothetical protein
MIDRTTKLLLALVATGLWANALVHVFWVKEARAQMSDIYLIKIESHLASIASGRCANNKLC